MATLPSPLDDALQEFQFPQREAAFFYGLFLRGHSAGGVAPRHRGSGSSLGEVGPRERTRAAVAGPARTDCQLPPARSGHLRESRVPRLRHSEASVVVLFANSRPERVASPVIFSLPRRFVASGNASRSRVDSALTLIYTLLSPQRLFLFPGSSTVEHSAVNRRVASSNLARGANFSYLVWDWNCGATARLFSLFRIGVSPRGDAREIRRGVQELAMALKREMTQRRVRLSV